MPIKYLILALISGTFGFILWYALSSSLKLPKTFQIQYDVNGSYFNRILRRRLAGFLLYGVLPCLLIFRFGLLGDVTLSQLGVSLEWNYLVRNWLLALLPVVLLLSWLGRNNRRNLAIFPKIRVAVWTPKLLAVSAFFWIIYLVGVEFMFRGLVLQSVFMNTGNQWTAIFVSTGLYAMIHYFKGNRVLLFYVPYGLVSAYVTLASGSLLPAIILSVVSSLATEWLSIHSHPEIRVQSRLYD